VKTITSTLDKIIYLSYLAAAVITPLLFTTITTEIYEVPKMLFVYLLATIVLFATLFKFTLEKKLVLPIGLPVIALGIFLISQILSTLTSTDTYTSLFGYPTRLNGGLLSTFAYFILFTGALINLNTDKIKNIILALTFTAVAVSLWGIPSHFNRDPSCLVLTGELTSACWQKEFNPTLRIFSTFGQPNWLASYLVLILPISVALTLTFQKQKQVIFALASVLIFWALILTNSRSGLLGFGASVLILAPLLGARTVKSNLKIIGVLIISFALISFLFADTITSRIKDTIESSTQHASSQQAPTQSSLTAGGTESGQIRLIVWEGAINIWKHWPILGPGPETFVNTYYQYRPATQNQTSEWEFYYNKAHNEFLNYLATSGTVGFLAYLFLIVSLIYTIIKSGKLKPEDSYFQKAAVAAIFGYLTTIFFGFSTVATQTTFFIICASALILAEKTQTKTISLKFTTLHMYQKILQTFVILLFVYTLTIVTRLYLADVQTNNAQNASNARALVSYNSAFTTSPAQNPYLLADFAYNTALYTQNTQDLQNKETLTKKALEAADLALDLAPNNYLTTQKVVKTYIILANIDPKYTDNLSRVSKKLTDLAPTYPPAYLLLAQTYVAIGDKQAATKITNQTLELKPDYLEAQQLLDELTISP